MNWKPIQYTYGLNGDIILPYEAPFDGNPVLIKTNTGIVEAWWDMGEVKTDHEGTDNSTGWCWVCYDDKFEEDFDSVKYWMPLPIPPINLTNGEENG